MDTSSQTKCSSLLAKADLPNCSNYKQAKNSVQCVSGSIEGGAESVEILKEKFDKPDKEALKALLTKEEILDLPYNGNAYVTADENAAFYPDDFEDQEYDHPLRRERRISRLKARQKTGPGKLTPDQLKELQDLGEESSDTDSPGDALSPKVSNYVKV